SSTTPGLGTYAYSYSTSTNPNGVNSWTYRTVETLPGGSHNIVYSNYAGETMLQAFTSGSQQWLWFYRYDSKARIPLAAGRSAVTGYDETKADLLNYVNGSYQYLSANSGLIQDTDYYATTTTAAPSGVSAGLAAGGNLTVGTTYYYVVTTLTAGGESVRSSEVSVTPTGSNQSALISWSAVSGATGYNVYRGTVSGQENTLVTTTSLLLFTDTGVAASAQAPPANGSPTNGYYADTKLQEGQQGTAIL